MRITYIHQYFVTRSMPGGTRSYEQARRLVDAGHEVHVITTDSDATELSLRWRTTQEDGITVHWLPAPYSNTMSFARRIIAFFQFALFATIKATRIGGDVVLATSTPLTVAVPGVIAAKLRRARFVFEVRDLWPELPIEIGALRNPVARRLAFALARFAYRNADRVIALSPGMKDGVVAQGYPAESVVVVPNACDLDLFATDDSAAAEFRAARPWLQDRPLVTYVGTFGLINGVGYLVRLAARVAEIDPEVRFMLVGDGAERDEVVALARELGVLDRSVFVVPPVTKAEVPTILSAATVATSMFLPLPGMAANSANKFFDALAAGRPIAINYGGWQAPILQESGAGVVLDPSDLDLAAKDLVARVRDDRWLAEARRAARMLATTRFSRDTLFDAFSEAVTGERSARQRAGAR
ncbi:glycosyltransferase family 4 protein [Pseudonocardia sp.]|uniref:glycosyltransferase family 4 protein n=1 Tax=Pseudonocardia sp. TaxID=60912 RepID=UPI003D14ABF3